MKTSSEADGPARPSAPKLLLTVEEAADLLSIGRSLMYALIRSGAIPSVRIGRLRRIRPADLAAFTQQLHPTDSAQAA